MCGIAGIIGSEFRDQYDIKTVLETIKNRGPDSSKITEVDVDAVFAFARLAFVGEAECSQPVETKDGRYYLMFNGEVYNHRELRQQAISRGWSFSTQTDTEVLFALLMQLGIQGLSLVDGMFAFVLYDREEKEVILARDHAGIKSLYYQFSDDMDSCCFSSSLDTFIKASRKSPKVSAQSLLDFIILGYVPSPYTALDKVYKLRPGEVRCLRLGRDSIAHRIYHSYKCSQKKSMVDSIVAAIHSQLDVRHRPSLSCSGGLDSSLIYTLVGSMCPSGVQSYHFEQNESDESRHYKELSEQYPHVNDVIITREHTLQDFIDASCSLDELFNDTCVLPSLEIAKEVQKRGDRILLSGAGADEVFLGYHRYNSSSLSIDNSWLTNWWMKASSLVPSFVLTRDWYLKISTYVLGIAGYASNTSSVPLGLMRRSINKVYRGNLLDRIQRVGRYVLADNPYEDRGLRKSWLDMGTYLPDHILAIADKTSMMYSVECRVPFLSKEVLGFARLHVADIASMNKKEKATKVLFRKGLQNLLGQGLLEQKKQGFARSFCSSETKRRIAEAIERLAEIPEEAQLQKVVNVRRLVKLVSDGKSSNWELELISAVLIAHNWINMRGLEIK